YRPGLYNKSSVLYNFVPDSNISDQSASIALSDNYLYFGRLSSEKGLFLLCSVFARRPHLTLNIAGTGELESELKNHFLGASNIRFLGKLNGERLREEIDRAWFTIVPSEWYENNPMSILESFGRGVPVIGASIGG